MRRHRCKPNVRLRSWFEASNLYLYMCNSSLPSLTAGLTALAASILLSPVAIAGTGACRPSWMPKDEPAFCPWQAEQSLPEATAYEAVATVGRNIYVIGGYRYDVASGTTTYYDGVFRSFVKANGHLSTWLVEPAFSGARSGAGVVAVGDCLYLSGGSFSTTTSLNYYDDVQSAHIGSNGKLSSWTVSPNHLNVARSNLSLIAVNTSSGTFLEAVAGVAQIGGDTVHLDTIEAARVEANCGVGRWTLANYHLKGGRSSPQALAVWDNLVVLGGWGDLDLIDVYGDVQVSTPRADGSPSPWRTSAARLPTGIYGHATMLVSSPAVPDQALLLSLGGQPSTGAYANWVSYAYVSKEPDLANAISLWRIAPTGLLTSGRAGMGAVVVEDRVYVLGGTEPKGKYDSDVLSAQFDFGHP